MSVIIPVYNAERFLEKAVESAVHLPQVGEIILVEDNSPDNALSLCIKLEKQYEKVKLFKHPNGENRGAGASRNLGVQKAIFNFVAFLDADDYYLPDRFKIDEKTFLNDLTVDGVYNAVGVQFYDDQGRKSFQSVFRGADKEFLTTVHKEGLSKSELIMTLINNRHGYFHTNGITVRKEIFSKTGGFKSSLRLHQDIHMWVRLSYYGNLVAGNIKSAVAIRGVHKENRHVKANKYSKELYHKDLFLWGYTNKVDKIVQKTLFRNYIFAYKERYDITQHKLIRGSIFIHSLIELSLKYPRVLRYFI